MSRTVTALFDTREDAEAGKARLNACNIDADNVRIHDQATAGYVDTSYSTATTAQAGNDQSLWGSIKNAFLPDEDRHAYEEGIRRGGYVLTADVDEDEIDEAVAALEDGNGVNLDERTSDWRAQGWDYAAPAAAATPFMADDTTRPDTMLDRGGTIDQQLVVGTREVDRGGMRARSYVTEQPVHEQVRLRRESGDMGQMSGTTGSAVVGTDRDGDGDRSLGEMASDAVDTVKQGFNTLTGNETTRR